MTKYIYIVFLHAVLVSLVGKADKDSYVCCPLQYICIWAWAICLRYKNYKPFGNVSTLFKQLISDNKNIDWCLMNMHMLHAKRYKSSSAEPKAAFASTHLTFAMELSNTFTLYFNFLIENKCWFTGRILKTFMKKTFKYTSKRKNCNQKCFQTYIEEC